MFPDPFLFPDDVAARMVFLFVIGEINPRVDTEKMRRQVDIFYAASFRYTSVVPQLLVTILPVFLSARPLVGSRYYHGNRTRDLQYGAAPAR